MGFHPGTGGSGGGGSNIPVASDVIWDAKGDLAVGTGADTASKLTVGSNGKVLMADSAQSTGQKWATTGGPEGVSGLLWPMAFKGLVIAHAVATANTVYLMRFIIPRDGTIAGIAYWVGVASGNYHAGIYDTGEASAGNRSLLWDSGSVAVPTAGQFRDFGNPNLAMTAGRQVDAAIQLDNTTAAIGRTTISNAGGQLFPSGYGDAPGGATLKLWGTHAPGSFGLASTIAEASVGASGTFVPVPVLKLT